MHQARIVMTSYPNEGRDLKRLIMGILKQQLGSCVQRINYVKAYYIWEGEIQKTEEKILLIKTTSDKEEKLIEFIKKNHPYELPEIMSIHPDKVDDTYLAWLNADHPIKKKEHAKEHKKEHKHDDAHPKHDAKDAGKEHSEHKKHAESKESNDE